MNQVVSFMYFYDFDLFDRMATNQICEQHKGNRVVICCVKCVRMLCPTCLSQQPLCRMTSTQAHEFTELEKVPACLRNQLDSIQEKLHREQSALLEQVKSFASETERKDEALNSEVARVVQNTDEAIQTLQQLQTAIRAATPSAIASVLRAAVASSASMQNVEDVPARALACRQLSGSIAGLRNLDDASLLMQIAYVRNLVRFTEPVAASPAAPPRPVPSEPASGGQSAASTTPLARQQSDFESELKNIIKQGKQLIHSLESIFQVCGYQCLFFHLCQ